MVTLQALARVARNAAALPALGTRSVPGAPAGISWGRACWHAPGAGARRSERIDEVAARNLDGARWGTDGDVWVTRLLVMLQALARVARNSSTGSPLGNRAVLGHRLGCLDA